jgi:transcriptional regulator with XRE-family HTH domain
MLRSDSNLSENSITSRIAVPFRIVNTERSTLIATSLTLGDDDMDAPPALSTYRERINWIRVSRGGLSLRALSMGAGLSPSTLGNLVRDEADAKADGKVRQMDADTAHALAKFAGVSIEWLLTGRASSVATVPAAAAEITGAPSPRQATEARRRASRALVELDNVEEKEAAFIVQNLDLPDDDADDALSYYSMARRKLDVPKSIPIATLESHGRDVSPSAPSRETRKRR